MIQLQIMCLKQKLLKCECCLIQMYDVFDEIAFDDIDGGAWKQGYDIKYQASQWTDSDKLQVFIIPHSHCDPGTGIWQMWQIIFN